jgi:hypothetical protein
MRADDFSLIFNYASSTGQPVGYKSGLLMQHLNTHKHQLRALGLHVMRVE